MPENPLDGMDINELLDPQRYKTTLNEAKANWQNRLASFKVDLDVVEESLETLPPEGEAEKKEAESGLASLRRQVRMCAVRIQVINRRLAEAEENDKKLMERKRGKRSEDQPQ